MYTVFKYAYVRNGILYSSTRPNQVDKKLKLSLATRPPQIYFPFFYMGSFLYDYEWVSCVNIIFSVISLLSVLALLYHSIVSFSFNFNLLKWPPWHQDLSFPQSLFVLIIMSLCVLMLTRTNFNRMI